jgi:uncharacterized repeat protein (TIGR03803 family)
MQTRTLLLGHSWAVALVFFLTFAFSDTALSQTLTVLHTFNLTDGEFPYSGLIHGSDGSLYGTTFGGGSAGCGTVFKIAPSGKFTSVYSFKGFSDGCNPVATVIRDSSGNVYGTTVFGGPANAGTVFKVTNSGKESVLYAFTGGADGGTPEADLIRDSSGNLYGTTLYGGDLTCLTGGCGTVFKISKTGQETVIHAFSGGADGFLPFGGLVRDSAGILYGTAEGGAIGDGTVFKIDQSETLTTLYDFNPSTGDANSPRTDLTLGAGGILYGTTYAGGDTSACLSVGCGAVFALSPSEQESILYSFAGGTSDGAIPSGPVVRDAAGNLYGATSSGGVSATWGIVYKLDSSGTETILHAFTGGKDEGIPSGRLFVNSQGTVFGTAVVGNGLAYGVVFKIIP